LFDEHTHCQKRTHYGITTNVQCMFSQSPKIFCMRTEMMGTENRHPVLMHGCVPNVTCVLHILRDPSTAAHI